MSPCPPAGDATPIPPPRQRKRFRYLGDALLLLLLLGLTVKVSYDVSAVRDLGMDDETYYMVDGFNLPRWGPPTADYSPLYVGWYYLLSKLPIERVSLYYGNWAVLVFLLSASVYLLGRALSVPRPLALIAASLVLLDGVADVWPYPVHMATTVCLLGTAVAVRSRPWWFSGLIAGLTLLVAAYVRPEYAAAFVFFVLVACTVAVVALLRGTLRWWQAAVVGAALAGSTAALLAIFGNPLGGGKLFYAFGSHYAHNVWAARGLGIDPWTNWKMLVRADFGEVETLSAAVRCNPRAFFWHLGQNLGYLPARFGKVLMPWLALKLGYKVAVELSLALLAGLGIIGLSRGFFRTDSAENGARRLRMALLVCLFLLAPILLSVVLIFPREHYLVPAGAFLIALLAAGVSRCAGLSRCWAPLDSRRGLVLLGVILVAVVPNRAHRWTALRFCCDGPACSALPVLPIQATVAALKELHLIQTAPLIFLEADYSRGFYADLDWYSVTAWEQNEGFPAFLKRLNVAVVVLDDRLRNDTRFRNDLDFQAFASGRDPQAFRYFPVPNTRVTVAVRKDRLPSCP